MELPINDQIIKLIKERNNILILTHAKADGDSLGSILSMYLALKKLGKETTALSTEDLPEYYSFLPSLEVLQKKIEKIKDFIITLDCKNAEVDKIKYNLEGGKINIIISPSKGFFSEKDVGFKKCKPKFDLIIVLDCGDLDQVGQIYDENPNLFFSCPVINIDHHASNTSFGKINLVDITASSTTEILYNLFRDLETNTGISLLDKETSTLLLTGIITDTGSFQNPNTTPASLSISAKLVKEGGEQQKIVQNIYKMKKLSTLKLWGKILASAKYNSIYRIVYSKITAEDFEETGAEEEETEGIIDELLTNVPNSEIILLLKERKDNIVSGSLRTSSPLIKANEIAEIFGGGGHQQAAGFKIKKEDKDFSDIADNILRKLKEYQERRLSGKLKITENNKWKKEDSDKKNNKPETDDKENQKKELRIKNKDKKPQTKTKNTSVYPEIRYLDFSEEKDTDILNKLEGNLGGKKGNNISFPNGFKNEKIEKLENEENNN